MNTELEIAKFENLILNIKRKILTTVKYKFQIRYMIIM